MCPQTSSCQSDVEERPLLTVPSRGDCGWSPAHTHRLMASCWVRSKRCSMPTPTWTSLNATVRKAVNLSSGLNARDRQRTMEEPKR